MNAMHTSTGPIEQSTGKRPLSGRVALVTGGSRGIGAAICLALAEQGATIAAGYSRDEEQVKRTCTEVEAHGVETSVHCGNIGFADDCRRVVREVIEQHGRLDILINNAGITSDHSVLRMTDDDWHRVLEVNLSGAFFLSQAALPLMLERGAGRIVSISSVIGQQGNIGQANYAASKSGLFGLTMTLAREAARANLRDERHGPRLPGADGQRRRAGLHRHRHGLGAPRRGDREGHGANSGRPPRATRGGRARRAVPLPGRVGVHHRPGLGGQRRAGDGRLRPPAARRRERRPRAAQRTACWRARSTIAAHASADSSNSRWPTPGRIR